MFPEAQWLSLSLSTDMFPYFQPIYQFPDGFNLLSPQNPIQITIVLIRILEDFFRGCRNIKFALPMELAQQRNYVFNTAMTEWMSYREVLFEKNYSTDLKDYVNNLYSKSDFTHSPIGKKLIFNLLWQTKYYFLPFFKIEALSFEKPSHEVTLRPLSLRVTFLRDVFTALSEKIDSAIPTRAEIPDITNVWEKYKFDIDNAVSVRLDALLGAKKNSPMAVNAIIIKYTAAILAVLDWWINDEASPARDQENFRLYRTSPVDGRPVFSIDLKTDANDLFKQNLKKLAEQAAGGQHASTSLSTGASTSLSTGASTSPGSQDASQANAAQTPAAQTSAQVPDAAQTTQTPSTAAAPQEDAEQKPVDDIELAEDANDGFVIDDDELAE
jgi:hypothetical protein